MGPASRAPSKNSPRNLVILDDQPNQASWLRNLSKARVVVVPILRETLRGAGLSVYLDAMLLKKCVIISGGPGVSDVLTDQALIVPPEDPAALAEAIRSVWEDPALRDQIAARGHAYATALGGELDLMNRILDRTVHWYTQTSES